MVATRFPVEAGHVMLFARSIGDDNPLYVDADAAAAVGLEAPVAPPTFAIASAQFDPDFPLRPRTGRPWLGSGSTPSGLAKKPAAETSGEKPAGEAKAEGEKPKRSPGANTLHAEQRFDFARPVRVGDVLEGSQRIGREWTKQSRSGATLEFVESITEFRDQDGELVVTSTSVAVTTIPPAKGAADA